MSTTSTWYLVATVYRTWKRKNSINNNKRKELGKITKKKGGKGNIKFYDLK
jgi:hypothetical protein